MTALTEYQRLECSGLWRESPESQRRDVIVTFGDATLVIKELPSERAVTHWSLPAVRRVNPGRMPALFSPGHDSGEEVEIDDETMIAAIGKVHAIIAARQPRPGRLRGLLLIGIAAALAASVLIWLPDALISHTAKVLPSATRQEIGQSILSDLERLTGRPCSEPDGQAALQQLADRVLGTPDGKLVILPEGLSTALHLPGKIIVVSNALIESSDTPEVAAGYILAERLRAESADPVLDALHFAGLRTTFQLLTTGKASSGAFRGYGEKLLKADPQPIDESLLLKRFEDAGVGSSAYAYSLDKTGESTLGLIEADPFATEPPPLPLLNDTDWVALQGICAN